MDFSKMPLAEKLRPQSLDEIAGQNHLLGKEGLLRKIIQSGRPISLLFWGPPGCGKTTLARIYANAFEAKWIAFSAVSHTIADLKNVIKESQQHPLFHRKLILFVDEIHRFNKAQQDAFLPLIEDGTLILIGATTENPSFALNPALLSRLRVLQLSYLNTEELEQILQRFEVHYHRLLLTPKARQYLIDTAQGDARHLLNMVENLGHFQSEGPIDADQLSFLVQKRPALYDRAQDVHHQLISALHKSVRGSDPDAALYWLVRMLEGGEDRHFIARRLVRMATEDIGLADPDALQITLNAWQAFERLGSPEGELALAEAVIYLALAPKSNAVYTAFLEAQKLAKETSHYSPPKTIINSPTSLMKQMGYGNDYQYDHDTLLGFSGQEYFPDEMQRSFFYRPVERGFEREMKKRLEFFLNLRKKIKSG